MGVVKATPHLLYPRQRPGTHPIRGWVGPRVRLDGSGKYGPHWDSIPERSSPGQVSIRTEQPQPTYLTSYVVQIFWKILEVLQEHFLQSPFAYATPSNCLVSTRPKAASLFREYLSHSPKCQIPLHATFSRVSHSTTCHILFHVIFSCMSHSPTCHILLHVTFTYMPHSLVCHIPLHVTFSACHIP